eukprot:Ihof_evm3s386 gene=Ihof_evmTU3s386
MSVVTGVCKWFNSEKGFGFITPDDGSPDVFVHQTSIHAQGFRSLAEGEKVEFTVENDPNTNRPKAQRVTGPEGNFVQGAPRGLRNGPSDGGFSRGGRGGYGGDAYGMAQGGYGGQGYSQGGYGGQQGGYGGQAYGGSRGYAQQGGDRQSYGGGYSNGGDRGFQARG